jgi:hypothetical protein
VPMKFRNFIYIVMILTSVFASGQASPIPVIYQPLVPAGAAPGGDRFTLTINGAGFTSNAVVYWNGSLRATTVVSGSTVQTQITAADIAQPGFGWVTVGNLSAGEVQSNVVYFPIRTSAKGVGFLPTAVPDVTNPGPTAVGDFNNDGILDFVATGEGPIQVFLGKGDGTFQQPIQIPHSATVLKMITGDFNNDGNLDFVALNVRGYEHLLQVYLGKGDGTFEPPKELLMQNAFSLSAADFDGDGKLDLYVAFAGSSYCTPNYTSCFATLLGNGDGTFGAPGGPGGTLPSGTGYPAIGDFNGDGQLDVAVAGYDSKGQGVVDVYLSGIKRVEYPVKLAGDTVAAADVNGDGKLDLVTDGVSVLLGNGDGTFRRGESIPSGGSWSVNLGDFNGDGKLDVAAGLNLLLGNGDGTFQKPLTFADMEGGGPISMGAFDAIGNLRLLGINALTGTLSMYEQRPLYFTPISLNFGTVTVGTTSPPQAATLKNVNATKIVLSGIKFTGANAEDFGQTNNCDSGLLLNKSCEIQVTFTPSIVGSESASLNVTYKGSPALSMPLSGTGTATFAVSLTPPSLAFGTQLVGTTSSSQTATLQNTGTQPVTISNIQTAAPFGQSNNCPASLPVAGSCQIQVTFSPTSRGIFNGTLSVTDDATGSPQSVSLSGTGIGPDAVFSPTGISFGNQKVGTSSVPVPVTLSNQGEVALTISQIAIKGTDPNDFSQTNNCPASLAPQAQCKITVTFTPTAKGSRSAEVSVSDNEQNSPQTVPLSGNGT